MRRMTSWIRIRKMGRTVARTIIPTNVEVFFDFKRHYRFEDRPERPHDVCNRTFCQIAG